MAVKQRFTEKDVEEEKTTHCTACYRDVYSQAQKSDCVVCFGTGYTSGFRPTIVKKGYVTDVQGKTKYDKHGEIIAETPKLFVEADFVLETNDMAVAVEFAEGRIIRELVRYIVGDVTQSKLRVYPTGILATAENSSVIQSAPVARIPESDFLYTVLI